MPHAYREAQRQGMRKARQTLTPDEVRTATFNRSPLAWRGYSEDEVTAFLGQVADSMVEAGRERAALRKEINRLRNYYRNQGEDVDRIRLIAGGPPENLLDYVVKSAWWQLEVSRRFAELLETDPDEADATLYDARVRAALAMANAIDEHAGGRPGLEELRRVIVWLRAFAYATQVQVDGASDVLREAQAQATRWQQP
jgi:DivIVA domain-containing protein